MAISSDSSWIKMLVLHLVFSIQLIIYIVTVFLKQVDKMTTREFLKYYVSGSKTVFSEHILYFLHSMEEIESHILSLEANPINRKDQYLRK